MMYGTLRTLKAGPDWALTSDSQSSSLDPSAFSEVHRIVWDVDRTQSRWYSRNLVDYFIVRTNEGLGGTLRIRPNHGFAHQ